MTAKCLPLRLSHHHSVFFKFILKKILESVSEKKQKMDFN